MSSISFGVLILVFLVLVALFAGVIIAAVLTVRRNPGPRASKAPKNLPPPPSSSD